MASKATSTSGVVQIAGQLLGSDEMIRNLEALGTRIARKVARKGVQAAMTQVAKSIRAEIPPQYKTSRKAIGSRFIKSGTGRSKRIIGAKVGVHVGKKNVSQTQPRAGRPGVGIGVPNIHWLALGTAERRRQRIGGLYGNMEPGASGNQRRTGRMRNDPFVKRGLLGGRAVALAKMRTKIGVEMDKEVKKLVK